MIGIKIKCEDGYELKDGSLVTIEVTDRLMNRDDYMITFITECYVRLIPGTHKIWLPFADDSLGEHLTNNHGVNIENVKRWIHKGHMTKTEANRDTRMSSIIDQVKLLNAINVVTKDKIKYDEEIITHGVSN